MASVNRIWEKGGSWKEPNIISNIPSIHQTKTRLAKSSWRFALIYPLIITVEFLTWILWFIWLPSKMETKYLGGTVESYWVASNSSPTMIEPIRSLPVPSKNLTLSYCPAPSTCSTIGRILGHNLRLTEWVTSKWPVIKNVSKVTCFFPSPLVH